MPWTGGLPGRLIQDVINGDVDGDILQAEAVVQCGGDLPLNVAGNVMDGHAVGHGDGKVNDGSAAKHAGGGAGVTLAERAITGKRAGRAGAAASEGDAYAADQPCAVAGKSRHDAGGNADSAAVGDLQGVPHIVD